MSSSEIEFAKVLAPSIIALITLAVSFAINSYLHRRNTLFNEEKEAILNFYSAFWKYYNTAIIDLNDYSFSNIVDLHKKVDELPKYKNEVIETIARLEIFTSDESLYKQAKELFKIARAHSNFVSSRLLSFDAFIRDVNSAEFKLKLDPEQKLLLHKALLDKQQFITEFSKTSIANYAVIERERKIFIKESKRIFKNNIFRSIGNLFSRMTRNVRKYILLMLGISNLKG
ncbi:MAG TPA: hypothetical protein VF691_17985 [Cytophagaceae bacterium]